MFKACEKQRRVSAVPPLTSFSINKYSRTVNHAPKHHRITVTNHRAQHRTIRPPSTSGGPAISAAATLCLERVCAAAKIEDRPRVARVDLNVFHDAPHAKR